MRRPSRPTFTTALALVACSFVVASCAPDGAGNLARIEESASWSTVLERWTDVFVVEEWTTGTFEATDMRFLPDGRALLLTKGGWGGPGTGKVILIEADGRTTTEILDVPVCSDFERGLLGIEIDPEFESNQLVYLFYTRQMSECATATGAELESPPHPVYNRLSSFVFDERGIDPATERVLLDELPGHQSSHNAGGLGFLPDGSMLVAVGEATYQRSRELDFVGGKLLRIDADSPSRGLPDNPFYDESDPGSVRSMVYASGLRNPFRFGVDHGTGLVAVGDVGTDQFEEINLVEPGGDYGFPDGEGPTEVDGATGPALWYDHAEGCVSVIGGTWVPAGWVEGSSTSGFAFTDFACGRIWVAFFDDDEATRVAMVADSVGHAVASLVLGPDDALYAVGIGAGPVPIVRITPASHAKLR